MENEPGLDGGRSRLGISISSLVGALSEPITGAFGTEPPLKLPPVSDRLPGTGRGRLGIATGRADILSFSAVITGNGSVKSLSYKSKANKIPTNEGVAVTEFTPLKTNYTLRRPPGELYG